MSLRFLTAGESHGPALTTILEGIPAGLSMTVEVIDRELARRQKGFGSGARMKIEKDQAQILAGVMGGKTTGAPISILISNTDHSRWKGKAVEPMTIPRPGHADLTGAVKYGFTDLRPALERASARETAARVAAGAVCKHFLSQFGITVGGYVYSIGSITSSLEGLSLDERIRLAEENDLRCPDPTSAEKMHTEIEACVHEKDTLGGTIEIAILGMPVGLGSFTQWDQRLEARLGAAILSVQAIKGVEIGDAFENANLRGTQVQDLIELSGGSKTDLIRPSNRAGGIEGGISNGQPILLRAAMKPIATTLLPQRSVDLATGKAAEMKYERSDFCPVPRAVPILESMAAFVVADALIGKLGGDSIGEMMSRFAALRRARLEDLSMDNIAHVWWE